MNAMLSVEGARRSLMRGLLLFCLAGLLLASARADQNAAGLDDLFSALAEADSAEQATELESQIWSLWLEAPDESARLQLTQVVKAMQNGALQLALKLCNQLVDGSPGFAEALNKRATIHYLMDRHDESVADIGRTLALEPRHFGAISGLGLIFLQRGDLEAALDAFEQVLEISPQSANARRSAERVRQELGREI